ncbi:MAG: pseudouridine synthase [Pseudomonadota bacterium]
MGDQIITIVIGENPAPRFDKALAQFVPEEVSLSRSRLVKLIEEGAVMHDDAPVKHPKHKAKTGDIYRVTLPALRDYEDAQAEDIPLDIVFEDDGLIVVNKPAGMVTHPAPGSETGTLVNALLHHFGDSLSGIGGERRPGIVHRIDKDTSGLLVIAKSDAAHQGLARQFKDHSITRRYIAITKAVPDRADPRLRGLRGVGFEDGGVIRIATHMERHKTDRKRMTVTEATGRHAITRLKVIEPLGIAALCECQLQTGRTHQIRLHASYIGHGLIGDPVYGKRRSLPSDIAQDFALNFPRQALHAAVLGFDHPITNAPLFFEQTMPEDMQQLLTTLRNFA